MSSGTRFVTAGRRVFLKAVAFGGLLGMTAAAGAAPVPQSGFSLTPFGSIPAGATAPDSVVVGGGSVFVGFGNGGLPDGSDNKTSTIAQYTTAGALVHTYNVPGHNDGLRVDPSTGLLYSMQNEDGNANLQLIDPKAMTISKSFTFGPTPHGGGYDDIVFQNGAVFFSASNPTLNGGGVSTGPALVQGTLGAGTVAVKGVLAGNATATDLVTGKPVALNLTDPDSTTIDNAGNIVVDDQTAGELVFIHNANTVSQTLSRLAIVDGTGASVGLDDTLFIPSAGGSVLLTDTKANVIYALHSAAFTTGSAFSNGTSINEFGNVNTATGLFTPEITGLHAPHGLAFLPAGATAVPLPSAASTGLLGLAAVVGAGAIRTKISAARRS